MKFPLPRPVFPKAEITRKDEKELVALVDSLTNELLEEEVALRGEQNNLVDSAKWKLVRTSNNVTVYREHKHLESEIHAHTVPPLLTVGHIAGSLDDLLYGLSSPSREAALIKTSYVKDGCVDVEILRRLVTPSLDNPFSHVTLKWVAMAPLPSLISPRDYVYLDSIGTRTLRNGERVGYRLTHSIDVRGVNTMNGIVRGRISVRGIFREGANNVVHMYGRVFYEPSGDIPRSLFSIATEMQVTAAATQMVNAQHKKLALALRRTQNRAWTIAVPVPEGTADIHACGVCQKSLHLFNKSSTICALCTRQLCHGCRVRKELSFLHTDYSTEKKRITFCMHCARQAFSLPSAFAAAEEFLSSPEDFYRPPSKSRVALTGVGIQFHSFLSI